MSIKSRLQTIEYQLLKTINFTPTDEQLVEMTNSILYAQLRLAIERNEDLSNISNHPTSLLGTTITWDPLDPEGNEYTITKGSSSVTQDADDPMNQSDTPGPEGPSGTEYAILNKILFTSNATGNSEIYSQDVTSGVVTQITNNGSRNEQPSVSPDGTKIAFISDISGSVAIHTMDIDGNNISDALITLTSGFSDGYPS